MMKTPLLRKTRVPLAELGIVISVVLALVFATVFFAPAARASSTAQLTPANGATQQWAFGGSASSKFSCSNQSCFGNATINGTFSLSWQYYIEWVVIYTVTNVSASQTMIEVQTALNASAAVSFSACIQNGTAPCHSESASLNLAGRETAAGFTNITTGTVNLTASSVSPLGNTPALAIENAASSESFNFSGSESVTGLSGSGGVQSGSANFDLGGQESSSVTFSTPLGVVPLNPQPGDAWTASAPFSAHGSWSGGYSFSTSQGSASRSNWTSGTISPSGTETVNGTDLGQYTLYDNYTNPATTITVQLISLDFGSGVFVGEDGWLLVPATLFGGLNGVFLGAAVSRGTPSPAAGVLPGAGGPVSTSGESAYFQHGVGFVGAAAGGTASIPTLGSGPAINLKAGPEPVSLAQQQYSAITSGGSSSSGFPWTVVILVVVVVLVAIVAALLVLRRRRRPAAATPAVAGVAPMGTYPGAPAAPTGPTPSTPTSPAQTAPPMAPPIAPVCPRCGQPGTYIAQYSRYYCYNDKQYL